MFYLTVISIVVTVIGMAVGIYTGLASSKFGQPPDRLLIEANAPDGTAIAAQRVHVHNKYEAQPSRSSSGSADEQLMVGLLIGFGASSLFARHSETLGAILAGFAALAMAALAAATRRGLGRGSFLVLATLPVAAGVYGLVLRELEFVARLSDLAEWAKHLFLFVGLGVGCIASAVLGLGATSTAARWSTALQFSFRGHLLAVTFFICAVALLFWLGQGGISVEASIGQ